MTEELRGLLRAELAAERPPPLGDLVATALRDGRRIRRLRRWAGLGGGTAVAGVLAATVALGGPPWLPTDPATGSDRAAAGAAPRGGGLPPDAGWLPAGSGQVPSGAVGLPPDTAQFPPGTVQFPPGAAQLPPGAAQLPPGVAGIGPGTAGPVLGRVRATPEAMLVLLEELLPPGRTSAPAATGPRDLHVQLYLDRGAGPGMIRVSVSGDPAPGPRPRIPAVSILDRPDNCIQRTVVRAEWPGGLVVRADLASCLARAGGGHQPAPQVLSRDEARAVVTDPRWGPAMDAGLVRAGAVRFPHVASFS